MYKVHNPDKMLKGAGPKMHLCFVGRPPPSKEILDLEFDYCFPRCYL